MDDKKHKDIHNKLDNMKNELAEYMSQYKSEVDGIKKANADFTVFTELDEIKLKLKIKIDSLEKANQGLEEKISQLDNILSYWDNTLKKKIHYKSHKASKRKVKHSTSSV
jgi:chaperonin cofactor prefoldin